MKKDEIIKRLGKLIEVLDGLIGDTEPDIDDLTEDEIIEYEPNYYLMSELIGLQAELEMKRSTKGAKQ